MQGESPGGILRVSLGEKGQQSVVREEDEARWRTKGTRVGRVDAVREHIDRKMDRYRGVERERYN